MYLSLIVTAQRMFTMSLVLQVMARVPDGAVYRLRFLWFLSDIKDFCDFAHIVLPKDFC